MIELTPKQLVEPESTRLGRFDISGFRDEYQLWDHQIPFWALALLEVEPRTPQGRVKWSMMNGFIAHLASPKWWMTLAELVQKARETICTKTLDEWREAAYNATDKDTGKGTFITDKVRDAALSSPRAFVQFVGLKDDEGEDIVLKYFHTKTVNAMRRQDYSAILLPYEHGKSYLSSIVVPLMDWAEWNDASEGRVYLSRSHVKKWVARLKREVEGNEQMQMLFPWIRKPTRDDKSQIWSEGAFSIGGRTLGDAGFEALTAQTYATGNRYARVGCVPPYTLVETPDGDRRIDEIRVGDLVRTHTGEMRPVLQTSRRKWTGNIFTVRTKHSLLRLTAEHPMMTKRGWVKARDLKVGDRLMRPHSKSHQASVDWGRLMGLYAAEGCATQWATRFTFANHERDHIDFVRNTMASRGIHSSEDTHLPWATTVLAYKAPLAREFKEKFGHRAPNKRIPEEIFDTRDQVKAAFIIGLLEGDGEKHGTAMTLGVMSERLVTDTIRLLHQLGISPSPMKTRPPGKTTYGGGPMYKLYVGSRAVQKLRTIMENGYTIEKITKRRGNADGVVCNLEVAIDHSYIAEGFAVHNCDDWVTTGNANSFTDQDKYWEYMFTGPMTFRQELKRTSKYNTKWPSLYYCGTLFNAQDVGHRIYEKFGELGYKQLRFDIYPYGRKHKEWVIWPEHKDPDAVEKMRITMGNRYFDMRCRNLIWSEAAGAFTHRMVKNATHDGMDGRPVALFGDIPPRTRLMIGFDPASGRITRDAAAPAIVLYGEQEIQDPHVAGPLADRMEYKQPERDVVHHIIRWQRLNGYTFTRQCDVMIEWALQHNCPIAFEDNATQTAYGNWITQKNSQVSLISHSTGLNKNDPRDGVEQFIPLFENKKIVIHGANAPPSELSELQKEFTNWQGGATKARRGQHTDLVMAIWIARFQLNLRQQGQNFRRQDNSPLPWYAKRVPRRFISFRSS